MDGMRLTGAARVSCGSVRDSRKKRSTSRASADAGSAAGLGVDSSSHTWQEGQSDQALEPRSDVPAWLTFTSACSNTLSEVEYSDRPPNHRRPRKRHGPQFRYFVDSTLVECLFSMTPLPGPQRRGPARCGARAAPRRPRARRRPAAPPAAPRPPAPPRQTAGAHTPPLLSSTQAVFVTQTTQYTLTHLTESAKVKPENGREVLRSSRNVVEWC